jgi:triacylglycerol lipase
MVRTAKQAALVVLLALIVGQPAAAEPRLTVPKQRLARALHCQPDVRKADRTPVMLVTATGIPGEVAWTAGPEFQDLLLRAGHPSCYVDLPFAALGDIQVAAEYLVFGIRRQARLADQKVGVYGISVGGVISRWALAYWPGLRRHVSDVVSVGAPHHGTAWASQSAAVDALCTPRAGCPAAFWQLSIGSRLLRTLNGRPDETPGRVAWTTVRTANDELVVPQTNPYPTSSLGGARNLRIQDLCPGRPTSHAAAFYDSVSFEALLDALEHAGPARAERFPDGVCDHPYATGADPAATEAAVNATLGQVTARALAAPAAQGEPAIRSYARRAVRRPRLAASASAPTDRARRAR